MMPEQEYNPYYRSVPTLSQKTIRPNPGLRHPFPSADSTSDYLNGMGIEEYIEVGVGQFGFSEAPMASFRFEFCDALILRSHGNPKVRAIAHITSRDDPAEYIDNLKALFGETAIEAIVVQASGQFNKDRLVQACKDRGIQIIQTLDYPMKNERRPYRRDIIIRPDRQQVIINSDEIGMQVVTF